MVGSEILWAINLTVVTVLFFLASKRYRWIYIFIQTLPRDIRGYIVLVKLLLHARKCNRQQLTVAKAFSALVKKHPQKVAFYFEDDAWTYQQVDEFSNKVATFFKNSGCKKGDKVALLLENCLEYPCTWLGLSKIGVVPALINTNLVKESLLHSIKVTECKAIIYGSNFSQPIKDVLEHLKSVKLYQIHEQPNEKAEILEGCADFRKELGNISGEAIWEQGYEVVPGDPGLYIFTSGTTGLPKAAVISNVRCLMMTYSFNIGGDVTSEDIVYTCLPLYHSAGGVMATGQALLMGTTVAIRKKFSATQYFKDCARYNVTVAQYLGELCRYLLTASIHEPKNHKVRTMVGNGLRAQIWKPFVEKFGIKNITELYGSTEGTANLCNFDNTVGAVGFIPSYLRFIFPIRLIQCDQATGDPITNTEGLCIECGIDEPGLLVGKIYKNSGFFQFDGYTDKRASEKKILTDVITKGDMYFNSGDMLSRDEFGYYYFKDRVGDTFRWKGENVSTTEVEGIIGNIVGLNDVTVYGVPVPENDGNAGMAAIVDPDKMLKLDSIYQSFKQNLPSYAIPLFLRVADSVSITGTFKLKKTDLREEGFNINKVKEPVYFLHPKMQKYVSLDNTLYEDILNAKLRL